MDKTLYLNERSFGASVHSIQEARRLFGELFGLLRFLDRRLGGLSVVGHCRLTELVIGNHPASVWFEGDRERARRVKQILSRAPFDADFEEIGRRLEGELEYSYQREEVVGLGLASWHDSLAVSVDRDSWRIPVIPLRRFLLTEDAAGEIVAQEDDLQCRHATVEQHVEHHADWLAAHRVEAPRTPDELWLYRTKWYPNIALLPSVRSQIQNLGGASPSFGQVVEKLAALQASLSDWNGTGLPTWRVSVTGEYGGREKYCRFKDSDGVSRLFEDHTKFGPGAGRIHFRLDGTNRRIIVAYVGRKLGI